jgi:tRNA pseudouridine65 synthase
MDHPGRGKEPLLWLRTAHPLPRRAIVVIDKPPNLLVHRSEIDRHETRFAIQILRDQIGRRVWPAHRLDRGTSGVLLFGLSPRHCRADWVGNSRPARSTNATGRSSAATRQPGSIDHPLSASAMPTEFRGEQSS